MFIFIYHNIDKKSIEDFITHEILSNQKIFLLKFFSFDINTLNHFSPVIVNTKLGLENQTINYRVTQANLDLLIKNGYYLDQGVIKEASNAEKEVEDQGQNRNDVDCSYSYSSDDDDDDDDSNDKPKKIFDFNKNQILKREVSILMNEFTNGQINFLIANENEIVYDDKYLYSTLDESTQIVPNDKIISFCIDFLKENLINLGKLSPKLILDYVKTGSMIAKV